jgi:hypothetical protein
VVTCKGCIEVLTLVGDTSSCTREVIIVIPQGCTQEVVTNTYGLY